MQDKNITQTALAADEKKNRNTEMGILTGIAIVLVVLGHLDMNEMSVFGLFPYYSFHVMVFLFVSGYFYDPACEDDCIKYILRKVRRLLVPYFICNLIYGVIATVLCSHGFSFCSSLNLYTLFAEPFLGGHQFGLNFASWFVPALFVIEVINLFARKIMDIIGLKDDRLTKLHIDRNILMFILTLAAGIATVALAQGGHVWGLYKTPGRILFMLPVYELGGVYRRHLEEKEKLIPDVICICGLCVFQFVIYLISGGRLNFSAVWVTSFAGFPVLPYITTLTGTWFWLRISRMISATPVGQAFDRIGAYSFHIMMHHVMVFFVINFTAYLIHIYTPVRIMFDSEAFHSDVVYTYLPMDMYAWKVLYLAAGLFIPACIGMLGRKVGKSPVQRKDNKSVDTDKS